MSDTRSLSRRTALAGLGVGSLGLFASHAAGVSARDTPSSSTSASLARHPLTGLWLSHVSLSTDPDTTAAAPAFFGADGSMMLVYPCAEASENGTQFRGVAIGTWAPIDEREARFTAVQVCFGADGTYQGTRTYDGYPAVSDDGMSFAVKGEFDLLTVRDATNAIVESLSGGSGSHMHGVRMTPGNAGFPTYRMSDSPENHVPEVAPVYPGDPRLNYP